jgi:hypothetical protein
MRTEHADIQRVDSAGSGSDRAVSDWRQRALREITRHACTSGNHALQRLALGAMHLLTDGLPDDSRQDRDGRYVMGICLITHESIMLT